MSTYCIVCTVHTGTFLRVLLQLAMLGNLSSLFKDVYPCPLSCVCLLHTLLTLQLQLMWTVALQLAIHLTIVWSCLSLPSVCHSKDPFENIVDEGFLLLQISFGLLLAVTHLSISSVYTPNVSKLRRLPLRIPDLN